MTRVRFVCPRNGEIIPGSECDRLRESPFWVPPCGGVHPHRVETLALPRSPSPQFGLLGLWCEYHDTALVPA